MAYNVGYTKMVTEKETSKEEADIKQLDSQIMKNFEECKGCHRKEKTYQGKCFWCFIESHNKLLTSICKIIDDAGRDKMIEITSLKKLRDEYLEA
jgi:hypothetical protein